MRVPIIEVNQPIGTFYLSSLPASLILSITKVKQREFSKTKLISFGGVQRDASQSRIKDITKYSSDYDATFPTPIIIAVSEDANYQLIESYLDFNENQVIGEVIDGQHRLLGLKDSTSIEKFNLPVIFMFDLTEEEKAYVFSIINSTQTKVSMSLIYDLFDLSKERSPQKTCHEIARLLNADKESPFYQRLKMLGKKENEFSTLSQGSFIKYMLPLISKYPNDDKRLLRKGEKIKKEPSIVLQDYFLSNKDELIYKIIFNLFSAAENVFPIEWNNPQDYVLSKTVGYGAILRSFPYMYSIGSNKKDLSIDFFSSFFIQFKSYLTKKNIFLTSQYFPSNGQQLKRLSDLFIDVISEGESE